MASGYLIEGESMQRFINNPDNVVDDMLEGYVKVHTDVALSKQNNRVIKIKNKVKGKVGVISGGGSGHEPAFLGYVGRNMLDAVAVGEVFSSPTVTQFHIAMKEADQGAGVAVLFGNYAGDNMNVKMAIEEAEDDDIEVKYVVSRDDIASSPKETKEKRHGLAGGFFMWKVGGAKAAQGASLDEVIDAAQNVADKTRSICVGLEPLVIPAVGKPNFTIEDGMMEFGIGHHGEAGIRKEPIKQANEIAEEMTKAILDDFEFDGSKELAVMISGFGSTPKMESYILYNQVEKTLKDAGHTIWKSYIGDYGTSLDMNGVSLTIVEVDDEIKSLMKLDAEPAGLATY